MPLQELLGGHMVNSTFAMMCTYIVCNLFYCDTLQKDGKHISWEHVLNLYNKNRNLSGLALVAKLKREHVYLNSYSHMRVDLAVQVRVYTFKISYMHDFNTMQVLSSTVAHALEHLGDDSTTETRLFIKNF